MIVLPSRSRTRTSSNDSLRIPTTSRGRGFLPALADGNITSQPQIVALSPAFPPASRCYRQPCGQSTTPAAHRYAPPTRAKRYSGRAEPGAASQRDAPGDNCSAPTRRDTQECRDSSSRRTPLPALRAGRGRLISAASCYVTVKEVDALPARRREPGLALRLVRFWAGSPPITPIPTAHLAEVTLVSQSPARLALLRRRRARQFGLTSRHRRLQSRQTHGREHRAYSPGHQPSAVQPSPFPEPAPTRDYARRF